MSSYAQTRPNDQLYTSNTKAGEAGGVPDRVHVRPYSVAGGWRACYTPLSHARSILKSQGPEDSPTPQLLLLLTVHPAD
jgi:hypothetical protein